MSGPRKVHQLSIYLVKDSFSAPEAIIDTGACRPAIAIPIDGHGKGQLYLRKTPAAPPKWTSLFQPSLDPKSVEVPGVAAAFLFAVAGHRFVLSFGQGGRFLIKSNVCEERFGLLCALNSVDPKSIRCVDVQSLDAIQSHTRIQSGEATTSDQFGLDVEQDMLKAIVGAPMDERLGVRMTGSDALSVSTKVDLSDLPFLLEEYRKKFEADLSATDHQWVNNITIARDQALTAALEAELEKKLAARDFINIWLSIPEIIDWQTVRGFMYTHGKRALYPDITLQGFLKTVAKDEAVTLALLRERQVTCADADHHKVHKQWSVFKCLYAEIDHGGKKYVLNDGRWFGVDSDFVARTNADFSRIPRSKLQLPSYTGGGEGAYNASVAAAEPKKYALLDDTKKVMHGGGHGQVEICDLLSRDKELIHVKHYAKSSVLSHLFAQGFVSGQLIQIDSAFRKKVRAKLGPAFRNLIAEDKRPAQDELTVVFAVISEVSGPDLHLPFFSRVNLNNTTKILRGFGFRVEILKIDVDDNYAKTVRLPSRKS